MKLTAPAEKPKHRAMHSPDALAMNSPKIVYSQQRTWSLSALHRNAERLYLFVFTRFRTVNRRPLHLERVWMPLFGKLCLRFFGGAFDRTCVRPQIVAFDDPTGRYAVRKAGFTSVHRAASARAPGLNFPALNFEVRVAYSSSIAHPGLAAMSCLFPFRFQVTPFDNPLAWSTWPRSFGPFYSPAQRPRPSWACVPREQRASDSNCRLFGQPTGSRSSLRRLAVGGYRSVPSC